MVLRKQIAFSQDNLTALASGAKETFHDLDRFQPSADLPRDIIIHAIELAAEVVDARGNISANRGNFVSLEVQVGDAAKFGSKDNVLAQLFVSTTHKDSVDSLGGKLSSEAHLLIGQPAESFVLAKVSIPGAIYLTAEIWHLVGTVALDIAQIKTRGSAIMYYSYSPPL